MNIGNIDKFCVLRDSASVPEEVPLGCNEAVGDFKLIGAGHDLFRCFIATIIVFRCADYVGAKIFSPLRPPVFEWYCHTGNKSGEG